MRQLGGHRAAADHGVKCGFHAGEARQALGSGGPGQQPQAHFRQADLGGRHGHAVMAAHGGLQTTTQRRAMDGGDHGLRQILDVMHHLRQPGLLDGLVEFGDVGARDEGTAIADEYGSLGAGICREAFETRGKAEAHGQRKRIDGRVVDGDDGNVTVQSVADDL